MKEEATMKKERIIQIVKKHHALFMFCTRIYNYANLKNRFKRGVRLDFGVTLINGLTIINSGNNNEIHISDFVKIKKCKIFIRGNNNKIFIEDFVDLNEVEEFIKDLLEEEKEEQTPLLKG